MTDTTGKEQDGKAASAARAQMKERLKAEVREFAGALKAQLREKKAEGAEVDLKEAMRQAEAEVEKKMAEQGRDVMNVTEPAPESAGAPSGEGGKKQASALPKEEIERLTQEIIAALKTIYDPEIPVDIYELGLIYRIDISDDYVITIDMTLTAPGCPVAGDMPGWVEKAVGEVKGVREVRVNLVFDPPWDMSRMSDEARLALNMW